MILRRLWRNLTPPLETLTNNTHQLANCDIFVRDHAQLLCMHHISCNWLVTYHGMKNTHESVSIWTKQQCEGPIAHHAKSIHIESSKFSSCLLR